MTSVTMMVEVGGARVQVQVRRSQCLYSECSGWRAGTAQHTVHTTVKYQPVSINKYNIFHLSTC